MDWTKRSEDIVKRGGLRDIEEGGHLENGDGEAAEGDGEHSENEDGEGMDGEDEGEGEYLLEDGGEGSGGGS